MPYSMHLGDDGVYTKKMAGSWGGVIETMQLEFKCAWASANEENKFNIAIFKSMLKDAILYKQGQASASSTSTPAPMQD